jgi:predicted negative regulator of RcsB-dependent stress response
VENIMAREELEYDSHEQSERVRRWFERNGGSIVIGILTAVALIWGYQAWQGGKERQKQQASLAYDALATAIADKKDADVPKLAANLRNEFADSTYAALGSLAEAAYHLEQNKIDLAIEALKYAQSRGQSSDVQHVASMRLGRLLLAKGDFAGALAAVEKIPDATYVAALQELKGDIYQRQGKLKEAFKAYDAALTATDLASPGRSTLQMKRDNLSGSSS